MQRDADALFTALCDPTRRGIFELLTRGGEQTVRALTDRAGVSQPATSKHLGILKRSGLIVDRRAGRETFYRVNSGGLAPLVDWINRNGAMLDAAPGATDAVTVALEATPGGIDRSDA